MLLNACDPLNLTQVIHADLRVPSVANNFLVLQGGRLIAARIRGQVEFFEEVPPEDADLIRRSLIQERKIDPEEPPHQAWGLPSRYARVR